MVKMLSFGSAETAQDSSAKVSKESVSLVMSETFSGCCFKDGSLQDQSIDVDGRIFMVNKLNKALSVELGMNLSHPNVFSGVSRRLRETETVSAYAVTIDKKIVSKVDPRGSIVVMARPEKETNAKREILQYKLKCKSCPLKVLSTCSVLEDDSASRGVCTFIIRQEFINVSDIVDLSDVRAEIDLPGNDSVVSCDLIGDNQMKFHLNADKQGGVCSYAKPLKRQKTTIFHLKIKLSGVNVNRFNDLDKQLKDGVSISVRSTSSQEKHRHIDDNLLANSRVSFTILAPKKNNSPNVSTLTGFALRYINVLDKTAKVRKNIAFSAVLDSFEASFSSKVVDSEEGSPLHVSTSNEVQQGKTELEKGGPSADDKTGTGPNKLVVRPWSWTDDALLLEEMYDEALEDMGALLMRSNHHSTGSGMPGAEGKVEGGVDFASHGMMYTDEIKADLAVGGSGEEHNEHSNS